MTDDRCLHCGSTRLKAKYDGRGYVVACENCLAQGPLLKAYKVEPRHGDEEVPLQAAWALWRKRT